MVEIVQSNTETVLMEASSSKRLMASFNIDLLLLIWRSAELKRYNSLGRSQNYFQIIGFKLVHSDQVAEWERKGSMFYVSYICCSHVQSTSISDVCLVY